MDKDDCHAPVIILGAPRPPHHLEDISDWVVDVTTHFSIIVLCSLDNDQVGREVDAPSQCARRYKYLRSDCLCWPLVTMEMTFYTHLNLLIYKQLFNCSPVWFFEASMVDPNSKRERKLEILVLNGMEQSVHLKKEEIQQRVRAMAYTHRSMEYAR